MSTTVEQPITVSTTIEEAVADLVVRGKERGYVTWEEMNETLPDNAIDPSELELILLRLEEEKIEITANQLSLALRKSSEKYLISSSYFYKELLKELGFKND